MDGKRQQDERDDAGALFLFIFLIVALGAAFGFGIRAVLDWLYR
jgi:hypothetical protein